MNFDTEVQIKDQLFKVGIASTFKQQTDGLSNINVRDNQGLLFVYPNNDVREFWMKDCKYALDILYLNNKGNIISMHKMNPEPPKIASETNKDYHNRLKRYSSGFPCKYCLELKGGTIDRFNISINDKVIIKE